MLTILSIIIWILIVLLFIFLISLAINNTKSNDSSEVILGVLALIFLFLKLVGII